MSICDPDAAVKVLEQLVSRLAKKSPAISKKVNELVSEIGDARNDVRKAVTAVGGSNTNIHQLKGREKKPVVSSKSEPQRSPVSETRKEVPQEPASVPRELAMGDVVNYKDNFYVVRNVNNSGNVQLVSADGKNFSGTPSKVNKKIKYIKSLPVHTENGNNYVVDVKNGKIFSVNGEVFKNEHGNAKKNEILDTYRQEDSSVKPETAVPTESSVDEPTNTEGYEFDGGEGRTFTTNAGQTAAINTMKTWYKGKDIGKPHFLLQGRGGTGKTTVINVLLNELNVSPDEVMFAAFMHKASKVLSDANADNKYKDSQYTTIASILGLKPAKDGEFKKAYPYKPKDLPKMLVVDEVSMLRSDHYQDLIELAAEHGTKIVFMGDHAQLPPVKDPSPKAATKSVVFTEQAHSTTHLNELMRQDKDSPIISATDNIIGLVNEVESILEGGGTQFGKLKATVEAVNSIRFDSEGFESTYNKTTGEGVIATKDNFNEVLPHLVNDLKSDLHNTKFVHYNNHTNANTVSMTKRIRKGVYGERASNEKFIKGEPLLLNGPYTIFDHAADDNNKMQVLDNAEEFTVVSSEKTSMKVPYVVNGKALETDSEVSVHKVTAYSSVRESEFVFFKPVEDTAADISRLMEILEKEEGYKANAVTGKFGMEWLVKSALKNFMAADLTHSYVINSHKSQGSSYNTVYMDVGNILSAQHSSANDKAKSMYVAGSRPKKRLVVMDSRRGGTVDGGTTMESVPLVNYTFLGINTAEKSDIINEVNKCSKGT